MSPEFHSENVITNLALKINKKGKLVLVGATSEQVEEGARSKATNMQRRVFFAYTSMVIAAGTAILAPLSAGLIMLYLWAVGLNLGLVFCMPFWITLFISSSLDRKAQQCKTEKNLVYLSRSDLYVAILKAGILATILVIFMMWLVS